MKTLIRWSFGLLATLTISGCLVENDNTEGSEAKFSPERADEEVEVEESDTAVTVFWAYPSVLGHRNDDPTGGFKTRMFIATVNTDTGRGTIRAIDWNARKGRYVSSEHDCVDRFNSMKKTQYRGSTRYQQYKAGADMRLTIFIDRNSGEIDIVNYTVPDLRTNTLVNYTLWKSDPSDPEHPDPPKFPHPSDYFQNKWAIEQTKKLGLEGKDCKTVSLSRGQAVR